MRNVFTLSGLFTGLSTLPAMAQDGLEIIGAPVDGEMGFQPAVSELARDLQWLDGMLLFIITAIS
ncbi:MAG: cytochrome c oxidase subunit II, partial [Paracoccaceae bacterium]